MFIVHLIAFENNSSFGLDTSFLLSLEYKLADSAYLENPESFQQQSDSLMPLPSYPSY